MDATNNEAYIKFCEIAKELGISDETIDLIKKDLKMTDTDTKEEPTEEAKPEVKAVEVSVEKTTPEETKSSPMMDMLSSILKSKSC
jgi:Zn-dependent peptidase ImmA (M78 family)